MYCSKGFGTVFKLLGPTILARSWRRSSGGGLTCPPIERAPLLDGPWPSSVRPSLSPAQKLQNWGSTRPFWEKSFRKFKPPTARRFRLPRRPRPARRVLLRRGRGRGRGRGLGRPRCAERRPSSAPCLSSRRARGRGGGSPIYGGGEPDLPRGPARGRSHRTDPSRGRPRADHLARTGAGVTGRRGDGCRAGVFPHQARGAAPARDLSRGRESGSDCQRRRGGGPALPQPCRATGGGKRLPHGRESGGSVRQDSVFRRGDRGEESQGLATERWSRRLSRESRRRRRPRDWQPQQRTVTAAAESGREARERRIEGERQSGLPGACGGGGTNDASALLLGLQPRGSRRRARGGCLGRRPWGLGAELGRRGPERVALRSGAPRWPRTADSPAQTEGLAGVGEPEGRKRAPGRRGPNTIVGDTGPSLDVSPFHLNYLQGSLWVC